MRRDVICHRCGSVNQPSIEVCAYCGLQISWKPHFPEVMHFWDWSHPVKWIVGALLAPLAFITQRLVSAEIIVVPLLTASVLTLIWTLQRGEETDGGEIKE